jgi:hypothetical protein
LSRGFANPLGDKPERPLFSSWCQPATGEATNYCRLPIEVWDREIRKGVLQRGKQETKRVGNCHG